MEQTSYEVSNICPNEKIRKGEEKMTFKEIAQL